MGNTSALHGYIPPLTPLLRACGMDLNVILVYESRAILPPGAAVSGSRGLAATECSMYMQYRMQCPSGRCSLVPELAPSTTSMHVVFYLYPEIKHVSAAAP